ncbi:MAG: MFS transporter [Rhizobiaceae bacterium]
MTIAVFNMIGSLAGGCLSDRVKQATLLASLSAISGLTLLLLALTENTVVTLSGLGVVGFTYGSFIAIFPASIAKWFGVRAGTRIYGRVFIAWGTAGLLAPWFAGLLFDQSGGYAAALTTAALIAALSAAVILLRFPDRQDGV